ncbi:MAG: hypothetical protein SNG35_01825 [Rikenellaceae bacterium]
MTYLYIDNYAVTQLSGEIKIGYDAEQLVDLDKAYEQSSIDLEIEVEPSLRWIFGGEGYTHAAARFNASYHYGAICCEGIEIVGGGVTLLSVSHSEGKILYSIRIKRSIGEWIGGGAANMFNLLPLSYDRQLVISTIYEGWEQSAELSPVKFFPVYRDSYVNNYTDSLTEVVVRTCSVDDYHPFINIYRVVETILEQDGYILVSSFMESDLFRNLYMSGAYSSQDSETIRAAMDFYAKRESSSSAVGSSNGRVYITSSISANSVGNFITDDSTSTDSDCFDNGHCLTVSGGTITFTPTVEVSMGLEFRIKYRTDHTIESRSTLSGYDRFYLYDSYIVEIDIPNTYTDNRERTIYSNHSYRIVVFNHVDGTSYRVTALNASSGESGVLTSWSGQTVLYSTTSLVGDGDLGSLELEVLSGGSYISTDLDWALYDGYVEMEGSTIVDLTVRTPPDSYSPSSPLEISFVYAECDYWSMSFELLEGSALSPVFAEYPGYGSFISFEDVAQHSVRQRVVIESLLHMFNLRLYTDELSRRVYIEPYDTLIDGSECFDWSDKIDESKAITFEDVALEVARERTWGYQRDDGYSERVSEEESEDEDEQSEVTTKMIGDWSYYCESYASIDSDTTILNPLFSTSLNNEDGLLVVGDRDDPLTVDTLEFAPRVVTYAGVELSGNISQPTIYFHSLEREFTLCFDDREGVEGLNHYYTRQLAYEQDSQHVTLWLNLSPYDVASLCSPLERRASYLSNFQFTIDGEVVVCRLQQLESYDVDSSLAECKFLIIK